MARGTPNDPARRCKATSIHSKQRCKRAAIPGGFVCPGHGGSAPQVRAKAQERLADLIDPDRVLREAAHIAYSDLTKLFDQKGNLLRVQDWPTEMRAAVSGLEVVKRNLTAGDGEMDTVYKLKLWDKTKAIELLGKHLALWLERMEHQGRIEIAWKTSE